MNWDMEGHGRRYLPARAEISADKSGDILYIFNHLIYSYYHTKTTFRTVRKDYRPARISPQHSRAHRATKPEKEAKNKQKGLKIRQIGQFGFSPSLFLSFWSLFGLFQVLFKAYPETKKQKTGCGRERNQKKQSKILIIRHPSMP